MAKADIAAGKAYVSLSVKKDEFTKALDKAKKELTDFGSSLVGIGAGVAGLGTAITGSLTAALLHFSDVGSALDDISQRTGVSATAIAEFGYAADMAGTNIDSVEGALKRMARNLGEIGPEGAKTTAALEAIGLSSERIAELSPEDQFQAIADGIAAVQNPTKKAATAMALFGESGRQLIPMFETLQAMRQEARDFGLAPSPESVSAAAEIGDAIDRVRKVISATIFEIGAAIAPMASDVLKSMLSVANAVRKFVVENKSLIVTAAKVGAILIAVGGAIAGVGVAFIGAGVALSAISAAISGFAAAMGVVVSVGALVSSVIGLILSPVGLLAAALIGAVAAWAKFTESGKLAVSTLVSSVTTLFTGLRTTVGETMGGIVEAVQAGDLALAGQIAMVGLRLAFVQGLEAIHSLFGEAIGTLVGQVLGGDFTGAWATAGSMILDSMSQVASGIVGMFTSAINTVTDVWATAVNKLVGFIFGLVEGIAAAFEAVTGIEVETEMERSRKLEAQRRQMGLAPQNDDIASQIAGGTYKDPGIEAIRQQIQGITADIDAGRKTMTDATGQAVTDATSGQAAAASAQVKALQDQLAALRQEATAKLAEETDAESKASAAAASAGMGGGIGGRSSIATNSLAALSALVSSPQDRAVKIGEQQVKRADKMINKLDDVVVAIDKLGMFHP